MERLVKEEMGVLVAAAHKILPLRQQEIRHLEAHHKEVMVVLGDKVVLVVAGEVGLVELEAVTL